MKISRQQLRKMIINEIRRTGYESNVEGVDDVDYIESGLPSVKKVVKTATQCIMREMSRLTQGGIGMCAVEIAELFPVTNPGFSYTQKTINLTRQPDQEEYYATDRLEIEKMRSNIREILNEAHSQLRANPAFDSIGSGTRSPTLRGSAGLGRSILREIFDLVMLFVDDEIRQQMKV